MQKTAFRSRSTKTLCVMRLTVILLTTVFLQLSTKAIAQQHISYSGKNVPLEKIFTAVEQQTGLVFFYNEKILKDTRPVTITANRLPLRDFLDKVFKDQPLRYSIESKTITVARKGSGGDGNTEVPSQLINVRGIVRNEKGEAVEGITVTVKGTNKGTTTNAEGVFELKEVDEEAMLVFSGVSIEKYEARVRQELNVNVRSRRMQLEEVEVNYSTGYQKISPERSTGSFVQVDRKLLNRRTGLGVLDRIENLVPGVLFNHGTPDPLLIRGRSSIFSDVKPLIVLDNFPYEGDINNINPNDVENITILKDAAAASIWGARAGNGVIVITTKRGKSSKTQLDLNSNLSFQGRPDLYNVASIPASEFIELEKYLFDKGHYAGEEAQHLANTSHPVLSPVIEILIAKRDGKISPEEADAKIDALKQIDAREDIDRFFYRTSILQQHSINLSGNSPNINYYLSGGWDRNLSNPVGNKLDRITLRNRNTFKLTNKLQVDAGIFYTQNNNNIADNPAASLLTGGKILYPYGKLVDENGQALPISRDYRNDYIDTAGSGKLLNWKYYPYDEIFASENTSKSKSIVINTGIRYQIIPSVNIELRYGFESNTASSFGLSKMTSYTTRNRINSFAQRKADGEFTFPVPKGGILILGTSESISHNGRVQIDYQKNFGQKHELTGLAGWEIKSFNAKTSTSTQYGYNKKGSLVNSQLDYLTSFQLYHTTGLTARIPLLQGISEVNDRFLSWFGNAAYTYDKKYTFSASVRNDAANLFGVKTNQKGVPLWSIGGAWQINKEAFYNFKSLSYLKLRATYGYNGNFSRLAVGSTTIEYGVSPNTAANWAIILNPPNEKLRWEQVRVLNVGLDFAVRNNFISGSIEFFEKKAKDLMGMAPADPTLGIGASLFANVANMKGQGIEFSLNTQIVDKTFKWKNTLLLSTATSKVTGYLLPASNRGSDYTNGGVITPLIGKPLYAMFSYQWAGLDPLTGDPRGYLVKESSKDYNTIINDTKLDSMVYHGPSQPTCYGAFRNTFSYKNIELSFNLSYKLGYYFRKNSVNYTSLYNSWNGHSDYIRRWKKAGDEQITNVPSQVYPANTARDAFYLNSAILVEKADQIRFEDINIRYSLDKSRLKNLPFSQVSVYSYIMIGSLLWTVNDDRIDPYYGDWQARPATSFSVGLNITF